MTEQCWQEVAANLGAVAEPVRVLPSRHRGEESSEPAGTGRVGRPVRVGAAEGAEVPTRPAAQSRSEKRGAGEWQEAKGLRGSLVGQERIGPIMRGQQIAPEEDFGEALRFAAPLMPVERVRVALVGDGAQWRWAPLQAAFPTGKEILDYYHCSEPVHQRAPLQYQDQNQQALGIAATMARLNFGEVESLIWGRQRLQPASAEAQEEIGKLIGYLQNNSHRSNSRSFKRGQ